MKALRVCWLALVGTWLILSVGALGQFVYEVAMIPEPDSLVPGELRVKLALELLVLNFPASAALSVVPLPISGPVGEWCAMTLAGFIQWVILVPIFGRWLLRRLDRFRRQRAAA